MTHKRHITLFALLLTLGALSSPIFGMRSQKQSLRGAAHAGNTERVTELIGIYTTKGQLSFLDKTDPAGNTALMQAAKKGHIGIVRLLIKAGAKTTLTNSAGKTAAQLAATDIIAQLIEPQKGIQQRRTAPTVDRPSKEFIRFLGQVKHGNLSKVRAGLKNNPEFLNMQDSGGLTPLAHAAREGHKAILIEQGAKVNLPNSSLNTPMSWAVYKKFPEIIALLRKAGGKLFINFDIFLVPDEESAQAIESTAREIMPTALGSVKIKAPDAYHISTNYMSFLVDYDENYKENAEGLVIGIFKNCIKPQA